MAALASDCGRSSHFGGAVAQLGERLVRNEEVRGSIPLGSTTRLAAVSAFTRGQFDRAMAASAGKPLCQDCGARLPAKARFRRRPAHPPPGTPRFPDDAESDTVPVSILRHRPFVLYWIARTCAALGFQMLGVAVGWQMYALTGNAFDLGLVGLIQFLPAAAFMLVAGQIADRYDRRRILQICQMVEAAGRRGAGARRRSPAGRARNSSWRRSSSFGVARAFEAPTKQTLLPPMVPPRCFRARSRRRHPRRSSRPSPVRRSAACSTPFGPTVSVHDLLRVCSAVGRPAGIRADRARRLGAHAAHARSVLRRRLLHPAQSDRARRHLARSVRGAARRRDRAAADLRRDVFDVGPEGLGLLRAAPAVGALTIMAVLTRWPLTRRVGRIMFAASPVSGSRPSCSRCRHRSRCRWRRWRCSARPTR